MDTFRAVFNESQEESGEIYAISLVEDSANLYDFIALSKTEQVRLSSDVEKQILTGVVLVPNQKIPRKNKSDGSIYEIYFDAETIEKLSLNFFKKGYQQNSTYEHKDDNWLDGITIYESWIVNDPQNDKANSLGFKNLPKGTWMISMKLSDELWQDYVKTGKAKGFSIDAFLQFEKVEMSKQLTQMSIIDKLKQILLAEEKQALRLREIEVDGMKLFSDDFEIGSDVMVEMEGEVMPLASKSFELDGYLITTDEKGFIIEKDEIKTEEVVTEEEPLTPLEMSKLRKLLMSLEEEVAEVVEEVKEKLDEPIVDVEALQAEVDAMKALTDELQAKVDEQEAELVELRKQPKETRLTKTILTNEAPKSRLAELARLGQKTNLK